MLRMVALRYGGMQCWVPYAAGDLVLGNSIADCQTPCNGRLKAALVCWLEKISTEK